MGLETRVKAGVLALTLMGALSFGGCSNLQYTGEMRTVIEDPGLVRGRKKCLEPGKYGTIQIGNYYFTRTKGGYTDLIFYHGKMPPKEGEKGRKIFSISPTSLVDITEIFGYFDLSVQNPHTLQEIKRRSVERVTYRRQEPISYRSSNRCPFSFLWR